MKVKYKTIANSLSGFSTPIFGLSWNPVQPDRNIVWQLIAFLEDRRVLYNPYELENIHYVMESILQIRSVLTEFIQQLDDESDFATHLRAMRAACRKYMDTQSGNWLDSLPAFGEFRAILGIHIAQLAVKYGVDVEEDLASTLPIEDK